jgi:hypothetical protein
MRIEGGGRTRDSRLGFNLTGNLFHNHFLGSKLYLSVRLEYQLIPSIYTGKEKERKIFRKKKKKKEILVVTPSYYKNWAR